jgi:hypothetical protein
MLPEELHCLLRARPFLPFRIHLDDGRAVEVRHPHLLWVGRQVAVLGVPEASADPHPYLERHETISLRHVVRLEPVPDEHRGGAVTPSDLLARVRQRPFRPFRLVLAEGPVHEVRRPDLVMVGRDWVVLGQAEDPAQGYSDRTVYLGLCNIVRLEPLEAPEESSGGGQ